MSAAEIVTWVGGARNIARLSHCMSRLRFSLEDDTLVDMDRLTALPEVSIVLWQSGELHVAMRRDLLPTHAAVVELIEAG